jgi:hypothetical protein
MNRLRLCPLTLVLLVVGCAPTMRTIHFSSEPAGARVFYGMGANEDFGAPKEFLGTAPCDWTVEVNGDGSFKLPSALVYSTFVPPVAVFEARPSESMSNCFVQRVVFHGGTLVHGPDKAPEQIFFRMTEPAPAKASGK